MAERGRGTSQNVPNDLLAQLVEVLQSIKENLQNMNRSVAPSPDSLFQGGFTLNAANEWVQGMECTNMKADGVVTSKSIPPKDFGPQRKFVHGRGKDKMFREERKPYFPPFGTQGYTSHGPRTHANVGGSRLNSPPWVYEEEGKGNQRSYAPTDVHRDHGYQGSKPTVRGFQPDVFPMCNKCGRKHAGTICPSSWNGCFHCKEKGNIKRFCPKLTRNVNVVKVGRPNTTGRLSTMSGMETSGVDSLIRGERMVTGILCLVLLIRERHTPFVDKAVMVGNLCEISDQASGVEPMTAKGISGCSVDVSEGY
ncbi:hypothetical protein Lal_00024152 [Lupinus albus]|nr:hypothetical protein Lal_00024152 [Lupinus albus]